MHEAASGIVGSIEERYANGRPYLYDKFRIGIEMKSRYLGDDTPDLRARIARSAGFKADSEDRHKQMARLARILGAEGFIATYREAGSLLTVRRIAQLRAVARFDALSRL